MNFYPCRDCSNIVLNRTKLDTGEYVTIKACSPKCDILMEYILFRFIGVSSAGPIVNDLLKLKELTKAESCKSCTQQNCSCDKSENHFLHDPDDKYDDLKEQLYNLYTHLELNGDSGLEEFISKLEDLYGLVSTKLLRDIMSKVPKEYSPMCEPKKSNDIVVINGGPTETNKFYTGEGLVITGDGKYAKYDPQHYTKDDIVGIFMGWNNNDPATGDILVATTKPEEILIRLNRDYIIPKTK